MAIVFTIILILYVINVIAERNKTSEPYVPNPTIYHKKSHTKRKSTLDKSKAREYQSELIRRATPAEIVLKRYLTDRIIFEFQKIIYTNQSFFIADFYIPSKNLIIELDGGYHETSEQKQKDAWRTGMLNSMGYKVIRFTNSQILSSYDLDWVLRIIDKY